MNKQHYIDLTHSLQPGIPDWDGCCGFTMTEKIFANDAICVQSLSTPAGIGTHMDAPCHFIRNTRDIASIPLEQLIVPAVIIDVRKNVTPHYFLSVHDIIAFEMQHGPIPEHSLVLLLTGWAQYWQDPLRYRAVDAHGRREFPGFSLASAEYLLTKNIVGIGIDTLSPDGSYPHFPVHNLILGQGKYILENLCNLENVPPIGAQVIALPIKINGGAEAPARIVAIV